MSGEASESRTQRREGPRTCPHCATTVYPERRTEQDAPESALGAGATIWLWRCVCGWANVRSESGVVSRRRTRAAILSVLGRQRADDAAS